MMQRTQQVKVEVIRLFSHDYGGHQPLAEQANQGEKIPLLPQVQVTDVT